MVFDKEMLQQHFFSTFFVECAKRQAQEMKEIGWDVSAYNLC